MDNNAAVVKENINKLKAKQKVNYIKNLLFNHEIIEALSILLKDEKKDLKTIKLIKIILKDELIINKIKTECNFQSSNNIFTFVYSKIISVLLFHNKEKVLNSFLKSLSSEELKDVAYYEYQNKTNASINSSSFNKYCKKYKEEALKSFELSEEEKEMFEKDTNNYNNMTKHLDNKKSFKNKIVLIIILILILLGIFCSYKYNENTKLLNKYKNLIYPGIYVNDISLEKVSINNLENVLQAEKEKIESGKIIVTNVNGEYEFTYLELGILVNHENVLDEIKEYNSNLSRRQKLSMIKNNKRHKNFYLNGSFSDDKLDEFINLLEKTINTDAKEDSLVVDNNYNVHYETVKNGFKLDSLKTKEKIKKALDNLTDEIKVEADGEVVRVEEKNKALSVINKKISTYTTYFVNTGNRGHNIVLASSKLNGTLLMPEEVFSYLKVVGPYGAANGYRPAPIYLNGVSATANGGGVCQLASTLYNAQLRAGLNTIYRTNHSFAPNYVPKGLDATVYSTTVDFRFKNQYTYPVYIVSYVKGNYLTVDIWSSANALGTKTYEPYSIYSNGGYLSYLKEYENGKLINQKYLDKSYYRSK